MAGIYQTTLEKTDLGEGHQELIRMEYTYELEKKRVKDSLSSEMNRIEEEAKAEAVLEKQKRLNHLQFSGIVLFILFLLSLIGFTRKLRIRPNIAEGLIFIFFLLLFEFILVYLDPNIDKWTGGEPAYKLIINAGLAGVIFPLHSFFEAKMKRRIFRTKRRIVNRKHV